MCSEIVMLIKKCDVMVTTECYVFFFQLSVVSFLLDLWNIRKGE